ncbi:hypothetical protein BXZ70DRAFT_134791 [Cristinia sonorae]|uniref:Protein-S-isoprenylcysteine O-methyltransferase n=1 Tax=Cristinia sonorae TaxID=1940300 RepID=A0A8K0UP61_9AGAR|nr:hypothetical protein BXZ70DRAFT_134791 [Cristinia sonorae]
MALAAVYPSLRISALDSILLPDPSKPLSTSDFYLTIPFVIGSLFLSAGALLRQACYRTLGRHFTFQLSLQKDHKLVTEGPYSFVRHPSYLGMIIALPGMAVAQLFSSGTWWIQSGMWHTWQGQIFGAYWISFLSYVCWALLSRVPKEDAMLQAQFGEQWVSWSKKTRYAVIPYVW